MEFITIDTSSIIEAINYIHKNKIKELNWLYLLLVYELKKRQPLMAKLYEYELMFREEDNEQR